MDTETQDIDVTNIYDLNHLKSIIASLKSDLVVARVDLDNNKKMRVEGREKHERDIRIIGEALIEEAEERDWCSQFDDFIEKVNNELSVELPLRQHEYDVEMLITQTRTQTVTVTVTARNTDEARRLVEDDPSNHFDGHISDYDWDIEDEETEITDVTEA